MEERIKKLLAEIKTGYDPETTHWEYDKVLEEFALNYNEQLLPLIKELISAEKDFWYA